MIQIGQLPIGETQQMAMALSIVSDRNGFFPEHMREQAYELIEKSGTEEQKEIASKLGGGGRHKVHGPLTDLNNNLL